MWSEQDISKSDVTTTGFTTDDEHLIKRFWVSKKCKKGLLDAFWTEHEDLKSIG